MSGAECLLAVAHPDDDAIFAGELQRRLAAARWTVVCLTYDEDSERGRELISWQTALGADASRVHFLGQPDPPDDWPQRRNSIDATAAAAALRGLDLSPVLVVTHNRRGDYGHPHHALVHDIVAATFPTTPRLCFALSSDADLTLPCPGKRRDIERYYPSQAAAIRRVARNTESFNWEVPPPPASEHGAAIFDDESLRLLPLRSANSGGRVG